MKISKTANPARLTLYTLAGIVSYTFLLHLVLEWRVPLFAVINRWLIESGGVWGLDYLLPLWVLAYVMTRSGIQFPPFPLRVSALLWPLLIVSLDLIHVWMPHAGLMNSWPPEPWEPTKWGWAAYIAQQVLMATSIYPSIRRSFSPARIPRPNFA